MDYSTIRLEIRDQVARLTLNRPDKMNAITMQMLTEVRAALKTVIASKDARVLVVTGEGRGFCAGLDLLDKREGLNPDDSLEALRDYFLPVFFLMKELRIPTIAALNGPAIGAGMALALSCDLVVAAQSAYFTCAFVNIGLSPDCGTSWFVYQKLGEARTAGMLLLGDKLPAAKAEQWGLIWQCVEDARLGEEVDALSKRFVSGPTLAYGSIRRLVQKVGRNGMKEQMDLEAEHILITRASQDYAEARQAFAEKRKPIFKGV